MGLVACPDCTKQISDLAPACIHCGRPMAVVVTSTGAATLRSSPSGVAGGGNVVTRQEPARYTATDARATTRHGGADLACRACASPDVRRLSIIHQQGVSSIDMATSGVGLGRGGLAVGHAHSNGVQQSVLSRQAAPPMRKDASVSFIAVSLGGMLALAGLASSSPAVFVLFLGVAVWGGYALRDVLRYNREVHPKRLEEWRASFMCLRCGAVFVSNAV